MKHSWILASAAAVTLSVGLAAQAPNQTPPTPQAPPTTQAPPATQRPETPSTAAQQNMLTMSGCVQASGAANAPAASATPGAVGTAGTAAGSQFTLTNARPGLGSAGAATTGTAAPAATYSLGGQTTQLKDHVGHQVEVTGRLAVANPDAARESGKVTGSAPITRFDVQSVKMIAPSCNTSAR